MHDEMPEAAPDENGMPSAAPFLRGDHVELGKELLQAIGGEDYLTKVVFDQGLLYRFVEQYGLWAPTTPDDCSRLIQRFAGRPVRAKRLAPLCLSASDIKGIAKCAHDQASIPSFFTSAPEGISFANGFLEVTAKGAKLKPLHVGNRARVGYWFDYKAHVKLPPLLGKFLADVFRGDADAQEKIDFLQEHAGISLLGRAPKFQRCALMVGGGDCGKSTYADIIMGCFPDDAIAAVTPQVMHKEYERAELAGKLLNYVAEMPEGDIVDGGPLKALTDGSPINARKPYGAVFQFRSRAGQLLNANRLPGTNDQTHGFFRRFVIVEFNRSFTDDPTRDVDMASKIIEAERPAIAAWLVAGAVRLLARGAYVLPASHARGLNQWQLNVDQVRAFLADQTHPIAQGEKGVGATALYARYTAWAEGNGHKPVSSTKLGVRLRELKCGAVHTKTGNRYPLGFGRGEQGEGMVKPQKQQSSPTSLSNIIQLNNIVNR